MDIETSHSRIQVLCEKLRVETLEPAKKEAKDIIEKAYRRSEEILREAHQKAELLLQETKTKQHAEEKLFQAMIEQAAKQTIERLKQQIEKEFFKPALEDWIEQELGTEKDHARLINVLVNSIEKNGLNTDLQIILGKDLKIESIVASLSKDIVNKLKKDSITLVDGKGGIQVKLVGKSMTIDLTHKTIEEILSPIVRKEFRKYFFKS